MLEFNKVCYGEQRQINDFVTDWLSSNLVPGQMAHGWVKIEARDGNVYNSYLNLSYKPGYVIIDTVWSTNVVEVDEIQYNEYVMTHEIEGSFMTEMLMKGIKI